jgi:UDP-GlcNAc:undecaprenyl-phosphate GlcNAc-1-phosphate transferase
MGILESFHSGLFLASGILLVLGLADDRLGLSPVVRLVVEGLAGLVMVFLAAPSFASSPAGIFLGAALVVFSVNAVNLFDGLDGLAGSAALVASLGVAWLGAGRGIGATFGMVLAGALVGFLVFNWYRARLFMGDNGAYVVGSFLAYGIMRATPGGAGPEFFVAAALLGVFAMDLVVSLLRRWLRGRPPFAGDRSHLYDQLRGRGLSVPAVAVLGAAAEASAVVAVIVLDQVLPPWNALLLLALAGLLGLSVLALGGFLRPEPT